MVPHDSKSDLPLDKAFLTMILSDEKKKENVKTHLPNPRAKRMKKSIVEMINGVFHAGNL